jgi:hypothetical protein
MGGTHGKRKTIMQGSGRYHEKRWNVQFPMEVIVSVDTRASEVYDAARLHLTPAHRTEPILTEPNDTPTDRGRSTHQGATRPIL